MQTMLKFSKQLTGGMFAATAMLGAQPAVADTINMVCRYQPYGGYSDIEVIWIDTSANLVDTVFSIQNRPGMHGLKGGGNIDDAVFNAKHPRFLFKWPATITPTSIKWTTSNDPTRQVEINRATGVLVWSTPTDPTPPDRGTGQCEKGDVPLPAVMQPVPTAKP